MNYIHIIQAALHSYDFWLGVVTSKVVGLPQHVIEKHSPILPLVFMAEYHGDHCFDFQTNDAGEAEIHLTLSFDVLYSCVIPEEAILDFRIHHLGRIEALKADLERAKQEAENPKPSKPGLRLVE